MSESAHQKALFEWAAYNVSHYPALAMLYAIPNGGRRDAITGARLKAEGVKAGVPDIALPVPNECYHGLYIEMKIRDKRKARVSPAQKKWIDDLRGWGYCACICYGWEDARNVIVAYLRDVEISHF